MTIKEELMKAGMEEKDFDHHESDLYIRVTDISRAWREKFPYKNQVTVFCDQIEHVLWYEVPFGYWEEWKEERRQSAERYRKFVMERHGLN